MVTQSSLPHNNGARSPNFSFSPGTNNHTTVRFTTTPTIKTTAPSFRFRTTPFPTDVTTPTSSKLDRYVSNDTNGTHGVINLPVTHGSIYNPMTCPPPAKRAPLFSPPPYCSNDTKNQNQAPIFSFGSSNATATATARDRNPSHTDWRTELAGATPFSIDNYLQNNPSPYPMSDVDSVGVKRGPRSGSRPTRSFAFGRTEPLISRKISANNTRKSGHTGGTVRQPQKAAFRPNLFPKVAPESNDFMDSTPMKKPPFVTNTSPGTQAAVFDYDLGFHKRIGEAKITTSTFTFGKSSKNVAVFDEELDVDEKLTDAPTSSGASTLSLTKTSTCIVASDDDIVEKVTAEEPTEGLENNGNQTADLEIRVEVLEERMVAFMGSSNEEEKGCPPKTTPTKTSNKAGTLSKTPFNTPNPQDTHRVTRSMSAKKKRSGRHSMTLRELDPV
ncbi:unnamed protein product [Cylindrotheca closterium]|uniref:Uncharacterized protein n=1 Tax=Cylindrotheca closterium TaxID=2856 RepID=A0AAD2CN70_9STRA|nr:unnamed protein product [Cylindrotheca closterium]